MEKAALASFETELTHCGPDKNPDCSRFAEKERLCYSARG